jgi:pimeloyl-ACP methyl ester carboxylesterase
VATPGETPPTIVDLPDGRALAVDDVGDPGGRPVLYLHGTPGSRLARHPDDGLAARLGVRLLAMDRPGYGASDPQPAGAGPGTPSGPAALAADVATVLDRLGVDRCGVLAWSGGALDGLAVAAGGRADRLVVVSGLVPRQAYDDPATRAAAEGRLDLLAVADGTPVGTLGDEVAPLLAPYPCDRALAAEHQAAQRDAVDAAEVASVPGADDVLVGALVEGVRRGLAGVAADVEAQNRPFAVDLGAIACPVALWWGDADAVTPPAFADWYARTLPDATRTTVPGAGHYLAVTRWGDLLRTAAGG